MTEILGPQRLGPLTPLVGEWEGNTGVDLSFHNDDREVGETGYYERAWFRPIPKQENGRQSLEGLSYKMTAWRHGEEAMIPFHDEVGYLLWEKASGQVMRAVVFGRGIACLQGATAKPRDKVIHFKATPGSPTYGILQNPYLLDNAELKEFTTSFTFNDDGSLSYSSDLVLKLKGMGGKEMHHTDRNTLRRVKAYLPGEA